jgi:hypothetical protein
MNHTHLVIANLNEAGTADPKKIRWSARDNVTSWSSSLSTGAGSQTLPDLPGAITGIAPVGDLFAIFCENTITLGYYVGGSLTFGFKINQIHDCGCYYPGSLISTGSVCYFWSRDNIYMYDGTQQKSIGDNVRTTVFNQVSQANLWAINAVHDKINGLIIWGYPTGNSTICNKLLIYNYKENRFSTASIDCEVLGVGAAGGFVIDDVPAPIDDINVLLDSPYYKTDSDSVYMAYGGELKTFTGPQEMATLETGELADEDKIFYMTRVYAPIYNASSNPANTYVILSRRYDRSSPFVDEDAKEITIGRNWFNTRCTGKRIKITLRASQYATIGGVMEAEVLEAGRR